MANGRPRYYRKVRNKAFWNPTKKMVALGFGPRPLGEDGPDAFREAERLNRIWDQHRRGLPVNLANAPENNLAPNQPEPKTVYPKGSIGDAFSQYRSMNAWKVDKSPRTREEWFRVWKRLKPVFGDLDPNTVSSAIIEAFRDHVRDSVSVREAHRVIKIWRALWNVMQILEVRPGVPFAQKKDPSRVFTNKAEKGRSKTWSEGEAVRLAKQAWRMRYYGLSIIIAVAWDTQMNPGDIRVLTSSQMARTSTGELFFTERGKTGSPVGGALSRRSLRLMAEYLEKIGVEMVGEAPIFRNRSGKPYSKDTLGDDFRKVKRSIFGDGETRTLGHDFRRSGAVEAIAGNASAEQLSLAMGNTLSASNSLFATYVPVNAHAIRAVSAARRRGRSEMRTGTKGAQKS